MLSGQHNSPSNAMAKIVCVVGSAHNMVTCLIQMLLYVHSWSHLGAFCIKVSELGAQFIVQHKIFSFPTLTRLWGLCTKTCKALNPNVSKHIVSHCCWVRYATLYCIVGTSNSTNNLTIGSDYESSHPMSNNESQTLSFQI